MTTNPHLDSDDIAIRAADAHRTANARAYADRQVRLFMGRPSWDSLKAAQTALLGVWLDHVRVLEERAASPSVEAWEDGPIKPPVPVNPAPITPAPNGERRVPLFRMREDGYR